MQIHPRTELAQELHFQEPSRFSDPNHKPEIAIALSKFEVFAGWKPLPDISSVFNVPSLRQFIPDGTTVWRNETLREVTRGLLQASPETVSGIESDIRGLSRKALEDLDHQGYIVDLLPRLQRQNGTTDPGSLVALLCMNFLVLEPGEGLYIPADGIHMYLSGDIIECMARSNAVLDSGFCPRDARDDIDLFADALTFKHVSKDDMMLPDRRSHDSLKGNTRVYRPPIGEFDVLKVELAHDKDDELKGQRGPSVAIVTEGDGTLVGDGRKHHVKKGQVLFVAPETPMLWEANYSTLQVYIAVV
ncbi:mannose-6-phosphate isomerase, class I [Candidatus Bathyarchaeota archaeon]|nr:mannose-6-phosphate isomerase, class I [Candidatus Bathyarchaeota archaeon]